MDDIERLYWQLRAIKSPNEDRYLIWDVEDFKESEHPREENGRFASSGSGGSSSSKADIKNEENKKSTSNIKASGYHLKQSAGVTYKKSFATYVDENNGNILKASNCFVKNELQGKSVIGKDHNGKSITVVFNTITTGKFYSNVYKDTFIAELIPHAPELIAKGNCVLSPKHKDRKDNARQFLQFERKIATSRGEINVILDVAVRPNVNQAYNLNYEGSKTYNTKVGHRNATDKLSISYVIIGINYK